MSFLQNTGRKMDAAWKKAISDGKKKLGIGKSPLGSAAATVGGVAATALLAKKLGPALGRSMTRAALNKALSQPTRLKTVAAATSKKRDAVINVADKLSRAIRSPADIKASMVRESKQRRAKAKGF